MTTDDFTEEEGTRCYHCGQTTDEGNLSGVFVDGACEQWCPDCWDDEIYSDEENSNNHLATIAAALVIALVGLLVVGAVAGDLQPYAEGASAWCEQHNGELENSRVIGEHGGLHCELPNGTSVHMDEVPKEELEAARESGEAHG